jgi:hypothetical protein
MVGRRLYEALLRLIPWRRRPRRPVHATWTCPGKLRPHPVALIHVERLHERYDDLVDIHRCEVCGRAYLCRQFEVNDWGSGGGDYCDVTRLWRPLEKAEFGAARADPNYESRSTMLFRHDTGWRREG